MNAVYEIDGAGQANTFFGGTSMSRPVPKNIDGGGSNQPFKPLFDSVALNLPALGLGEKTLSLALGTFGRSKWILRSAIETAVLGAIPRRSADEFIWSANAFSYVSQKSQDRVTGLVVSLPWVDDAAVEEVAPAPIEVETEIQIAARRLRDRSGLTSGQLGELFPIARESYSRYVSGAITPTPENGRLVLYLDKFVEDLRDRVPDVHSWLLTPITEQLESPYDLLKAGRFKAVRALAAALQSSAPTRKVASRTGERSVEIPRSTRSSSGSLSGDELDDSSGLFDDED